MLAETSNIEIRWLQEPSFNVTLGGAVAMLSASALLISGALFVVNLLIGLKVNSVKNEMRTDLGRTKKELRDEFKVDMREIVELSTSKLELRISQLETRSRRS